MAYDYDDFIDAMRFGLTMSDRDTTDDIWNMVDEVVDKARAFDEIVDEFGHYIDTLPSWESIDHKDTQTLLDIIKENKEGN